MMKRLSALLVFLVCLCVSVSAQDDGKANESRLIDAVRYIQFGRIKEAEGLLKEILEKDPDNDAAYYYMGNCRLYDNDVRGAAGCFSKAAALDSLNLSYQRVLASLYTSIGDESSAAVLYRKLRAKNPAMYSDPVTLTVLGDAALSELDDTLAMQHFNEALEQSPDYIPALLGKADVYRLRRDMPAFFAVMQRFVSNPDVRPDAKCQYVRGVLERMDASIYRNWCPSLDSLVQGCLEAHPGDSSAFKLASAWYFGTDRAQKGAEYVNLFLENYPEDLSANYMKVDVDMRREDYPAVIADCRRMLSLNGLSDSDRLSLYNVLGDCCYQSGKPDEAYAWYDKALRIDGDYVPVLNNYAYFLSLDGRQLRKALRMSRKTVDAEPDNPTYLDTYGWILFRLGKAAEAKPYFKHAILYGGKESKDILEHYADVLKYLGEDSLSDYYRNLAKGK